MPLVGVVAAGVGLVGVAAGLDSGVDEEGVDGVGDGVAVEGEDGSAGVAAGAEVVVAGAAPGVMSVLSVAGA